MTTIEQSKAAVQQAEQNLAAAESALKNAEQAEATARDDLAQAAWSGKSAEVVDALKLALPAAEGRVRIARLSVSRAEDALDRAKRAATTISQHKAQFAKMAAAAQRVAAIDATIATLAEGTRQQVLKLLEERLAVLNEAGDVLQSLPVVARQATDAAPLTARRWDPLLAALGSAVNPN